MVLRAFTTGIVDASITFISNFTNCDVSGDWDSNIDQKTLT
jgi:hypothetical protein